MNIFLLSDMVIYISDLWYIALVAILYNSNIFMYTRSTDVVMYFLFDWKDGLSLLYAGLTLILALFFHVFNALVTQLLRDRMEW